MRYKFADRADAGRVLADALARTGWPRDALVLALPRGGVPVASEVARELSLPLDVLVVRKLGVPFQPELAMGAIASGGALVVNEEVVAWLPSRDTFDRVRREEQAELERREREYRGGRTAPVVHDRTVILVDDGLATGATMEAAVRSLRALGAARVVAAVPVASQGARDRIAALADEVVCLEVPETFFAVGQCYRDFAQTSDADVRDLLEQARANLARLQHARGEDA
jgi:putative phosphoribosyl transferase